MEKTQNEDQHVTMMKLKEKNDKYREELKSLSDQLDQILSKQKKTSSESPTPNSDLAIDLARKKIKILEHEIQKLKIKSPRTNSTDRLSLESTANLIRSDIKKIQNSNKELEKKINDASKTLPESSRDAFEKKIAELRSVKEKLKNIEEKYANEIKNHEKTILEIESLEKAVQKKNENNIDYLKFESRTQNFNENDIQALKNTILEIENHRRTFEASLKQESENLLIDIKEQQIKLEVLRKELKNKNHELKIHDFEINNLKRKFRSTSTKRFEMSPGFANEIIEFREENGGVEVLEMEKLYRVKSDERIPQQFKKPPRSDNNSPAAQKIKALRSQIETVNKNVGLMKFPIKSKKLVKIN